MTLEVKDMKRKKLTLLVIGCVLLCLVVLREIGVVDVNLYKSILSTSQSSTKSQTNPGENKHFSYHLIVKHKLETLFRHTYMYDNLPPIEIEATQEAPVYSGNYVLPFVKNFKMTYQCEFTTTKSPSGHTVEGQLKGEVTAKVHGFCSRMKAKELAFEEAKKQIASYFQTQLNL